MERRDFFSTLAGAAAGVLGGPAYADELQMDAGMGDAAPAPKTKKKRGRWLLDNPKFQALSMDGKRQIEYAQPIIKKLPKPGNGMMYQYMFGYDDLSSTEREELVRLISYIEYMSAAELRQYLGVKGERGDRKQLEIGLRALSREPRIPYHSGQKVVVASYGPWEDRRLATNPPHPDVLPHAARELMAGGTYYTNVTGAPGSLQFYTHRVLSGGHPVQAQAPSISEQLRGSGIDRTGILAIAGAGTHAGALGVGDEAPYLLTTDDARDVDQYLERHKIGEKMKRARTPEEKRKLRKEVEGIAAQALDDMKLRERFPDKEALDFIRLVMFRERGIKDRGNTFVHVAGLRAMQLVHPKFLYVQFGGPDESLRGKKRGRSFGEQGAVGQGNYPDDLYLSDLDQWSYYHWLEAQHHPHYAGEATFVLLFGPQPHGATQAIVSGPGIDRGRTISRAKPLSELLEHSVSVLT